MFGAIAIAKNPRVLVGGGSAHGWTRLLPAGISTCEAGTKASFAIPHRGSLLYEKVRGKNVLPSASQKFFTVEQKIGLKVTLGDMKIPKSDIEKLLSRPIKVFRRIERCIAALVDNFLIADLEVFIVGSPNMKTFKKVVRKMFATGTYSCSRIVSDYKEWSNYVLHKYSRTTLMNGKSISEPNPTNIFNRLKNLSSVKRLLEVEDVCYLDCQILSHIVSTRNFPYCGKKTQIKAEAVFKEAITRRRVTTPEMMEKMRNAAIAVGRRISSIDPSTPSERSNHISLVSSGEMDYRVKDGAQAKATIDALTGFVSRESARTETISTPFGDARFVAGVPIWKTLFRDPDEEALMVGKWLEPRSLGLEEGVAESGRNFWGLDETAGRQILYIAYTRKKEADLLSDTEPIPLRASPIGELGDKCRWITVCEWWLNIIQAPFTHFYSDIIQRHPYAWTSFNKMDQTWEAAKALLLKYKGRNVPEWVHFMSSDLTNATNCQDRVLSKALLEGVLEGFGYSLSEYDREVLSLLDVDRDLSFPDGTGIRSTNGIFMGEHLAKISLVTLGLCVEELSYRETRNFPFYIDGVFSDVGSNDGNKEDWWRFFHLGGDDHIAGGPSDYLDRITSNYLACGSEISVNKHGRSRRCVRYCERMINLDQRIRDKDTLRANSSAPHESLIVDGIKCRLLAKDDAVSNKAQDTNTAIGKAKAFSGCIKWLPHDNVLWPEGKVTLIRNLFIMRMGGNLPNRVNEPKLHSMAFLPVELGGFDLNMDGPGDKTETLGWLDKSPDVIKWIVNALHGGWEMTPAIKNCIRQYNTAISVRGTKRRNIHTDNIIDSYQKIKLYRENKTYITFQEAKTLASSIDKSARAELSGHEINKLVKSHGYMPLEVFRRQLNRTSVFTEMAIEGTKNFQTRSWRATTTLLYELALKENLDDFGSSLPTKEALKSALFKLSETGYIRVWDPFCVSIRKSEEDPSDLLFFPENVQSRMNFETEELSVDPSGDAREDAITKILQKRFGLFGENINRISCYEMGSFSLQLGNFGRVV